MQTRKDLYQAHKLMTQRVALALLQGQPDAVESPMRRMVVASICGVMMAVLVAAGFGVAGLIFKGGARGLDEPGTLIIEKETGAKYGYSAADRKLIPFLNYASARLAMPDSNIRRRMVSRKSLAKYGRGPVVGIPQAPDALPAEGKLARAPWSLCVHGGDSGATRRSVVSLVGGRDVGGRVLNPDQGVLVRGNQQAWLVWSNKRLRVTAAAVRVLTNEQPVPVAERWLNGLPQGPDFAAPDIPGLGQPVEGPNGGKVSVGQVFRVAAVAGSDERWYVQLRDGGLAGLSAAQARLLLEARPAAPRDINPAVASEHPSKTVLYNRELPQVPPRIVAYDPEQPLCAVYKDAEKLSMDARFTLGGSLPTPGASAVTPAAAPGAGGLDQVVLPGGGTLAALLPGQGQKPQTYFLVTDQGVRFPIPTPEDVAKLGYSVEAAVPMPSNLLRLVREGPVLESSAARTPVAAAGPKGPAGP